MMDGRYTPGPVKPRYISYGQKYIILMNQPSQPLFTSISISTPAQKLPYNFSLLLFPLQPLNVLPPSNSITFPVICAAPALLKNRTTPAKSLG